MSLLVALIAKSAAHNFSTDTNIMANDQNWKIIIAIIDIVLQFVQTPHIVVQTKTYIY